MRLIAVVLVVLISMTAFADGRSSAADTAAGKAVYSQTCIACHGANGKGAIPGIQDLTAANGPLSKSDEELLASIAEGFQSAGSPMAMPPKGGNSALSAADVTAVLDYIKKSFAE